MKNITTMNTLVERNVPGAAERYYQNDDLISADLGRIVETETLGQMASRHPRSISVFKKYGLDFCCGGRKTIADACAEKGLDLIKVEHELLHAEKRHFIRPLPCNSWSLDFLCEYIVNTHHSYVKSALPELELYAKKVADVHSGDYPELKEIYNLVVMMASEMTEHMLKEEEIVFPYISGLVNDGNKKSHTEDLRLASGQKPIELMEMEHEQVGRWLHEIRTLTKNYTLPVGACTSYKSLYKLLEEFEEDLHQHVHLENNILFAKAADLEKSIK
jgi:regulator of cell morphogenesis and NO signaling